MSTLSEISYSLPFSALTLFSRSGARWLMTLGSAFGGLSLIGLAMVQSLFAYYALWPLGLGLAMALIFYLVSFTVVANWFEQRRGTALAILTLLGGLASPLFTPTEGWRSMLINLGVLQLVIAMPLHGLLLRRLPEDRGLVPA